MDNADRIAGMTVVTEGGGGNGAAMIVAMAGIIGRQDFCLGIGEVIGAVTAKTVLVFGDDFDPWPIERVLQGRRRGVAIAALVTVHRHRGIGGMTADTERGVEDMAQAGR